MKVVSILKIKDSVIETVKDCLRLINWQDFISPSSSISLKVNLGWDMFLPGTVTSPLVVEGVIQTLYSYAKKIYICDASQILVDVEKAVRQTKIFDLTKKYDKVEWVNLSQASSVKCHVSSLNLEIDIPEILLNTQIITIPVMKTHGKSTVSLALKNQWGCLPIIRYNYHPILSEMIYEINNLLKPKLGVIDGTVGLEGNGPKSGVPRVCNLILVSSDLVALDTVAAKIMGFEHENISHIQYCYKKGLGESRLEEIEIKGEDIDKINLNFKPAKNNLVSFGEIFLRSSILSSIVFRPPVLNLFCYLAKIYYFGWYYLWGKGRKNRERIIRHTQYGKQWQ